MYGVESPEAVNKPSDFAERIKRIPEVPGTVIKTLGSDFVRKFSTLMTSDEVVEIDILLKSGELTREQVAQYAGATGIYSACRRMLTDLAVEFSNEVQPKLISFAKKDIEKRNNKEGLRHLFHCIDLLVDARFASFTDESLDCVVHGKMFYDSVRALVGADLVRLTANPGTPRAVRDKVDEILSVLQAQTARNDGLKHFEGVTLYTQQEALNSIAGDENCVNQIEANADILEYDHSEFDSLDEETEADVHFVQNEALYKYIPASTIHDTKPQISIKRIETTESHGSFLDDKPIVIINFDSDTKFEFPKVSHVDKMGFAVSELPMNNTAFTCALDLVTGDLYFATCNIPLKQVMNIELYRIMQRMILKGLRKYLESKEPDIEDLFINKPSSDEVPNYIIGNYEGTISSTELESEVIPSPEDEQVDMPVKDPEVDVPPKIEQLEVEKTIPKHERAQMMQKISGARPNEILDAFRKLAGREVRISGSHFIFRNSDTGITYPIPKHSKGKIPLGIILDGIKALGYSVSEFAEKLGYETRGS